MKRRTFLTAAGTVGVVGVASSATVVSSVYNGMSLNILLEEFDSHSKTALDKLVCDITENADSMGLNASRAKKMAMPVQILSNDNKGGRQIITYKNKLGQTITLTASKNKPSKVVFN